MTPRQRRLAFSVAVAAILAACLLPTLLPSGSPAPPAGPRADEVADGARPKPTVQGADPRETRAAAPADAAAASTAARDRAAAFARAFLRYEVGQSPPAVTRTIARLANPGFGRALLSNPPRPAAGGSFPAPGRLVGIRRLRPGAEGTVEAVAVVRYGRHSSPMSITLERRRGRWLVTSIA